MDPIYGTFLDLRNSLLTKILIPLNKLMMYLMLSVSFLFTFNSYNIPLCPSFVYLRESPIWKVELGALVWVESLKTVFDGLSRGISNLCETTSLISSLSYSGVKSIGLPVLGSSFVHTEEKARLNVEYHDINTTLLKNPSNLLKPDLSLIIEASFLSEILFLCTSQNTK